MKRFSRDAKEAGARATAAEAQVAELTAKLDEARGALPIFREFHDALKVGFVRCERCGDQEDTATLDGMKEAGAALDRLAAVIAPETGKETRE